MLKKLSLLLVFVTGCGIHVTSDPIRFEKLVIEHKVDPALMAAYTRTLCQTEGLTAEEDIAVCMMEKQDTFLKMLEAVTTSAAIPSDQ